MSNKKFIVMDINDNDNYTINYYQTDDIKTLKLFLIKSENYDDEYFIKKFIKKYKIKNVDFSDDFLKKYPANIELFYDYIFIKGKGILRYEADDIMNKLIIIEVNDTINNYIPITV